jgi:hypothetical protein
VIKPDSVDVAAEFKLGPNQESGKYSLTTASTLSENRLMRKGIARNTRQIHEGREGGTKITKNFAFFAPPSRPS